MAGQYKQNVVRQKYEVYYRDKETGDYYCKIVEAESEESAVAKIPQVYEVVEVTVKGKE